MLGQYLASSFEWAMVCLFLAYIIGEAYVNNGYIMMINVTTPKNRSLRS